MLLDPQMVLMLMVFPSLTVHQGYTSGLMEWVTQKGLIIQSDLSIVHVPVILVGCHAPSFVCDDYQLSDGPSDIYHYQLVWDGKGCPDENSCCSLANLPWFFKQLPLTSDKKLEARICHNESFSNESVLVKEIKLYVQQLTVLVDLVEAFTNKHICTWI